MTAPPGWEEIPEEVRELAIEAIGEAIAQVRSGRTPTVHCPRCGHQIVQTRAESSPKKPRPTLIELTCDCGLCTSRHQGL